MNDWFNDAQHDDYTMFCNDIEWNINDSESMYTLFWFIPDIKPYLENSHPDSICEGSAFDLVDDSGSNDYDFSDYAGWFSFCP